MTPAPAATEANARAVLVRYSHRDAPVSEWACVGAAVSCQPIGLHDTHTMRAERRVRAMRAARERAGASCP